MKKPHARKLKVFETSLGFFDSVVAAQNQAAALRAWGMHQNLFANGGAWIATDEEAIKVALAHPQTPLRRAVGTKNPFDLNPVLPKAAGRPRRPVRIAKAGSGELKPKPTPKPADRSALDATEAALREVEENWQTQEESYQIRRAALDEEETDAKRRYDQARSRAERTARAKRQAFIRAGGQIDPDAD